jgi:uncharacterized protein (DUF1697 family)
MACVVFFRAVNVGGHQKFQPSALAKELAAFGVQNIGAAGTLVVREKMAAAKLRGEIYRRLPFKPELMIHSDREVQQFMASEPYRGLPADDAVTQYVSVLARPLRPAPILPLEFPSAKEWEIKILKITGPFVVCLQRPGKKGLYPNAIVEKHFSLPATTRNWNTFVKIAEGLKK